MPANDTPVSRRAFLGSVTTGVATAAGATSVANAQADGDTVVELGNYFFKGATESPLYITPGTTVKFVWTTGGHNIHVDSQPEAADWTGHETIENKDYTYTHAFTVKGKYHFWCEPHKALGMIGDIIVNESGQPPAGEDGGATGQGDGSGDDGGPSVPGSQFQSTFMFFLFGAIGISILAVLGGEAYRMTDND